MAAVGKRFLMVGLGWPAGSALQMQMERRGWEGQAVETLREAKSALAAGNFRIVLAPENLPDGEGYDLRDCVAKQGASLFVAVTLSESCLWLPVVERGERTLGNCALHSRTLEREMEGLVSGGKHAVRTKRAVPLRHISGRAAEAAVSLR